MKISETHRTITEVDINKVFSDTSGKSKDLEDIILFRLKKVDSGKAYMQDVLGNAYKLYDNIEGLYIFSSINWYEVEED